MKKIKYLLSLVVLIVGVGFLGACESASNNDSNDASTTKSTETNEQTTDSDKLVRLGTMNDEEGRIIGQMMLQILEDKGYQVESTVGELANNTSLMRTGIKEDPIDLSLDYTGRGLAFIDNPDVSKYQEDLETAFQTTKEADEKNGIIWLTYAPFNNTDSLAVSKEFSEQNNVKSLEDLARYVNDGGDIKVGVEAGYEYYATAETTLPGWQKAYGFSIPEENIVMGVNDAKTAVANNTDGINVATTNATSGLIESLDLIRLEDPKHVSPIYSPAPIATPEILEQYPELETLFNDLFASLDGENMIHLNRLLEESGQSEEKIAKDYLTEKGLLSQ
ncbi:glycine betaine ABC transporter substrate-binding protein [Aerococcus sp. UMB1112A]|uniref:glycine betaine ABC transporter substrate-binding protein n=1 Tax=Aerococcus sp. UMB1112A TaxID=3050609 RepID=UPI002551A2CD|nr:glycine betaine ABC transporter substrate-binding protein [Aerococcus sp. UMB1112A]MDK8502421.1 glycine betaine ABC transporter substrate-binding protein [Aerococcus sp. UMB1112A]